MNDMQKNVYEKWKLIVNPVWKHTYYVSNTGKVKRLEYEVKHRLGTYTVPETVLKPHVNGEYLAVAIEGNSYNIHILVATAFITKPNSQSKLIVNHIDGHKFHNDSSNLEWVTYSENTLHAIKNDLAKKPPHYTGKKIRCIETNQEFINIKTAAIALNLNPDTLSRHAWNKTAYRGLHFEFI